MPPLENWAERVCAGEALAVSRAITAIENHQPEAEELLRAVFPRTGKAYLTGITGAPGTGKSTLVDRLAAHYRRANEAVGVIAVDPTSPYTGGAILGDRIRMQAHAGDAGMFIRSMATRGFLGGLRAAIFWRTRTRDGGSCFAARCGGQRSGADRDRRRGAGRS